MENGNYLVKYNRINWESEFFVNLKKVEDGTFNGIGFSGLGGVVIEGRKQEGKFVMNLQYNTQMSKETPEGLLVFWTKWSREGEYIGIWRYKGNEKTSGGFCMELVNDKREIDKFMFRTFRRQEPAGNQFYV